MPKVLFVSDYACETGFGTVSKNIVAELKRHFKGDLKMDIIANNYFGEAYDEDENIFVAPAKLNDVKLDDYGRHFFLSALKNSNEYDILFIISDLGVVVPIIEILEAIKKEKREKNMKSFKSMYYFPMDCHGFPQILKGLEFFDVLVTYTEFGRNEILKVRPELRSKLKVINHGTNINDFYPLEPSEVFKFRNEFFGDVHSKCIISNINRNQPRKDIPTTIFAFKEAKECWNAEYPKPFLYLHMHPRDPMGWDLRAIFWQLDLVEGEDYKLLPDEWIDNMPPAATINNILNASDAYLTTTLAEGWGLTVTEAMAARIPVICPLNTSLTEMTSNGKRAITYETFYPVINTTDQIIRQQGDIGDVAACILKLADMRYDSTKNSFFDAANMLNNAYAWATGLTWHELSKRWIEYIKELS